MPPRARPRDMNVHSWSICAPPSTGASSSRIRIQSALGAGAPSAAVRASRHGVPSAHADDRPPGARIGSALCMGCQHVRKHVSGRDLNPYGFDLRRCSLAPYGQADNRRSESCIYVRGGTAPKSQSGAPFLTSDFAIAARAGTE